YRVKATPTTVIYPRPLPDALPICLATTRSDEVSDLGEPSRWRVRRCTERRRGGRGADEAQAEVVSMRLVQIDRPGRVARAGVGRDVADIVRRRDGRGRAACDRQAIARDRIEDDQAVVVEQRTADARVGITDSQAVRAGQEDAQAVLFVPHTETTEGIDTDHVRSLDPDEELRRVHV